MTTESKVRKVAHDLNNVLTVIVCNVDEALEAIDSTHPAYECLIMVEKVARSAGSLSGRLIDCWPRETKGDVGSDGGA